MGFHTLRGPTFPRMSRRLPFSLLAILCSALIGAPAAHAATPPSGPAGDAFYTPMAEQVPGPEGTIIWARPATGLAAAPSAARTTLVLHRMRGVAGTPVAVSGTVVRPKGTPPAGGWPVVAYNHMTTGGGGPCGPSNIREGDSERRRKHEDARLVARLLARGIAVVRSDYEGIETPGPHPYFISDSLARSTIMMVRAARALEPGLSTTWATIGHSEGAAASIWATHHARELAPDLDLRAVAALTPPLTTRESLDLAQQIPVRIPGLGGLAPLGALVLTGLGSASPEFDEILRNGGLSARATSLLGDIETRCLTTLGRGDSWGALIPARILGPRGAELKRVGYPLIDAHSPLRADIGSVPLRLEAGGLDLITPAQSILNYARRLRTSGKDVTFTLHPLGTHSSMLEDGVAMSRLADWTAARLR